MLPYIIIAAIVLVLLLINKPGRDLLWSTAVFVTTGGLVYLMVSTVVSGTFFEGKIGQFLIGIAALITGIFTIVAVLTYITEIIAMFFSGKQSKTKPANLQKSAKLPETEPEGLQRSKLPTIDLPLSEPSSQYFTGRIVKIAPDPEKNKSENDKKLPGNKTTGNKLPCAEGGAVFPSGKVCLPAFIPDASIGVSGRLNKSSETSEPMQNAGQSEEKTTAALRQNDPAIETKVPPENLPETPKTESEETEIIKSVGLPDYLTGRAERITPEQENLPSDAKSETPPDRMNLMEEMELLAQDAETEINRSKTPEKPEFPKYPGSGSITDYSQYNFIAEPEEKEKRIDWEKIAAYLKKKKDQYIVYDYYAVAGLVILFSVTMLVMVIKIIILSIK